MHASISVFNYEARTRHQRCRTRVRCDEMQRHFEDAAARASDRVPPRRATWISRVFSRLAPTRADAAPTRANSRGIGPTWA